jgi:hypothetical protein
MSRSLAFVLALLPVAVACNSYTFDPVGRCLIQPGSVRVRLSKVSSADILFVVDDSPSTDPKQQGLAASFGDFIHGIVDTNAARTAKGLEPIDFHLAITTSSVFFARPTARACVAGSGGSQCCQPSACADVASCTPGTTDGCGANQVCTSTDTLDATGQYVVGTRYACCTMSACAPSAGCAPGDPCPALQTAFPGTFPGSCTQGLATAGAPYPAGAFVSAPANPKILDFPKTLGWSTWGTAAPDPALTTLVRQFQDNVRVGSCGSGEEQHLEAARLALQKALAGQQPGVAAGAWPHPGAKLVVVWVGDEDDCSSPVSAPLVMTTITPGADSCVQDKHRPPSAQREIPVQQYADFLAGLVHDGGAADVAAAFVVSAVRCADGTYAPADSCTGTAACPVQPPASCQPAAPVCSGASAAGERFFALADDLRSRGFGVVEGTVCDAFPPATFGPVLSQIAGLLPEIDALHLPTPPASRDVTTVVIEDPSGSTRKICQQGRDWCFVGCADRSPTPACLAGGTSQCIAIDHVHGQCEANPDETYAAEYAGRVPAGGCAAAADCQRALGGAASDWTCTMDPGASRGSCTCAR